MGEKPGGQHLRVSFADTRGLGSISTDTLGSPMILLFGEAGGGSQDTMVASVLRRHPGATRAPVEAA